MTVIDTGSRDEGDLDEGSTAEHIHGICLKTGPPRLVGVELEWLVRDVRDPALPVPAGRTAAAIAAFGASRDGRAPGIQGNGTRAGERAGERQDTGAADGVSPGATRGGAAGARTRGGAPGTGMHGPGTANGPLGGAAPGPVRSAEAELPSSSNPAVLPSGALLTAEPGGQLEISSQPADSLAALVRETCADLTALHGALAAEGLELAGIGLDPLRSPRRVLNLPRYAAMEAFFDSGGPWGRQMMGGTTSVQVCLDAGDDSDGPGGYRWRWRLLHALGPVLVGAFANSPLRVGKPTGWVSSRQQVWSRMDPGRTRSPRLDGDPRTAWADYALDADLMCIRGLDSEDWTAAPGLTLRDWVRNRSLRPPTADDVDYHLSTLFPPVRPRGHFELRMIDAQPGDGWIVPLAVCCALLSDAQASRAALAAVSPLWGGQPPGWAAGPGAGLDTGPWLRAARLGPADPATGQASRKCFAAARAALDRMAVPASVTAAVDAFTDRYVSRDRCPADDLLEEAK